jgi:predicted nucleotidyltransferase
MSRRASTITSIFPSPAMGRLVVFFVVHPGQRVHLRALMRMTGLPSASIQTELRRLTRLGVLRREDEGGRAFYAADEAHPAWRAWMLLFRACVHPTDVLREALVGSDGIEMAFVFGSTARGDRRADSDVDLLLVGGGEAQQRAGRVLSEAQILIEPELDVITYDADTFRTRAQSGNQFIQRILGEPKEWVRGDASALDLAEAA